MSGSSPEREVEEESWMSGSSLWGFVSLMP